MDTLMQELSKVHARNLIEYSVRGLKLIAILLIGFWVAKRLGKLIRRFMEKRQVDPALCKFLHEVIVASLKVTVIISALSTAGIETTSFIAVLGAAGLAVGLALQGSLNNFAGGVLLLFFKPLRVADFITTQGHSGTVEEIGILYTTIVTPDKRTIILPNGLVANNPITNFSKLGYRRVEVGIGIGYDSDIDLAKKTIRAVIEATPSVLQDQNITVAVMALGASSIDLAVRCFTKNEDYLKTGFELHENIKKALDRVGVQIPFPQRDIHIHRED